MVKRLPQIHAIKVASISHMYGAGNIKFLYKKCMSSKEKSKLLGVLGKKRSRY